MTTELYLVRHGESVPNVQPVIGGMRGDAGLTERGQEQARLLGQRLSAERMHADQLYASTLPRALETAEHVSRALRLPVQPDEELHELRPGQADGLTVDQWRERYRPGEQAPYSTDPFRVFSPGGESWATFLARAGTALARLVSRHPDETVVAVCHAGVVEASFALAFGMGGSSRRVHCAPQNTSLTHWRHRRSAAGQPEWTLVAFDDARHLTAPAAPAASGADTTQAVPLPGDPPGDGRADP